MSDMSQGPGWWQASDGKWYPPEQSPTAGAGASAASVPGESAHGPLADWGTRAIAYLIDVGFAVVLWIIGFILVAIVAAISETLGAIVGVLLYIVLSFIFLYYGFLVGAKGRSPGMAIIGLRCVGEETGQVIGGGMGVVRTIAHIVDSIICYVGWFFPLWDPKRQTLADKIMKTVVVKDDASKAGFGPDLFKP
ncbi:RDD family protein [Rhabdothermincola sp. EGI L10124]|nr:RDD family protein [Rhabdothermincola salaria]MCD9622994.1 RDD family protein [Rhabdothermincola salaria]